MTVSAVTKESDCLPRILFAVKRSFKNENNQRKFSSKQKQRDLVFRRPAVEKRPKGSLQANRNMGLDGNLKYRKDRRATKAIKDMSADCRTTVSVGVC